MATPTKYQMDILKQLTRIANSLEKIEKKTQGPVKDVTFGADGTLTVNYGNKDLKREMQKYNCTTCAKSEMCTKRPDKICEAEPTCCTEHVLCAEDDRR